MPKSVLQSDCKTLGNELTIRTDYPGGCSTGWIRKGKYTLQISIVYKVLVNQEGQYSIWPCSKEIPSGWYDVGFQGEREACLSYCREIWTDMRPLSLKEKLNPTFD